MDMLNQANTRTGPASQPFSSTQMVGDVVVYKTDECLSVGQFTAIKETMEATFPGQKVLVLGDGASISLLSDHERLDRIEALLEKLVANTNERSFQPSYSIDDLSGKPNAMRMQRTSREDDQVGKGGV